MAIYFIVSQQYQKKIKFEGVEKKSLIQNRKNHYSGNLKISYKEPLILTRGYKNYSFDENGNCFLDFYNNVPHVGHSHPRIAELAFNQLKLPLTVFISPL